MGAYGWQSYHLHVPTVLKSGRLKLLEPSGPVQGFNQITLPLLMIIIPPLMLRVKHSSVFSGSLYLFAKIDFFFHPDNNGCSSDNALRKRTLLQDKTSTCSFLSLTFWHRSFTFNSNKSLTWWTNFSVYYPDVCLQFNTFWAFSRPSSGIQWLQWQPLVLPSYRGDSSAVFVVWPAGRPTRPRTQHDCHHDTKVKPEAATAVIGFLMMGGKTPKTFWAVNKHQDNKLKFFCIRLVIYLNCTMMHGLTNLKFYI